MRERAKRILEAEATQKDWKAIEDLFLNTKRDKKAKILEFPEPKALAVNKLGSESEETESDARKRKEEIEEEADEIEELGFYENTAKIVK